VAPHQVRSAATAHMPTNGKATLAGSPDATGPTPAPAPTPAPPANP